MQRWSLCWVALLLSRDVQVRSQLRPRCSFPFSLAGRTLAIEWAFPFGDFDSLAAAWFELLPRSSVPFSVITVTTAGYGWRQVKLFGAAGVGACLAGDERPVPWHRVTPSAQEAQKELEVFP